jgi:hypothetical protein
MKKLALTTAVLLGLCLSLSTVSTAATVDVNYGLTGGLNVTGPSPGTLTPGAVLLGTASLSYSSTPVSPGSIVAGPVHVQALTFVQSFGLTNLFGIPGATLTGAFGLQFPASSTGALTGGGALNLTGNSVFQLLSLHCNAAACGALSLTGFTSVMFSAGTLIPTASLVGGGHLGTATPGALSLTGPIFTNFITVPVSFGVTGNEVSRTFVPEPGTGALVAFGVAAMAGASSLRRRRR